jgi:hypothetical protein
LPVSGRIQSLFVTIQGIHIAKICITDTDNYDSER